MEKLIYIVYATEFSDLENTRTLAIGSFETREQAESYIDNFNDSEFRKQASHSRFPNQAINVDALEDYRITNKKRSALGLEFEIEFIMPDGAWMLDFFKYDLWIAAIPFYI